ncbi:MAG: hypothetical protein JKY15_01840 [Deltaproteobacteria bacterium]|nr:hypothetical protein [Deltaproteobacteria bacterium]
MMAGPNEIRGGRLRELRGIVSSCIAQNITDPQIIIAKVRKRAYEMAAKDTAEEYVQEIIRNYSK